MAVSLTVETQDGDLRKRTDCRRCDVCRASQALSWPGVQLAAPTSSLSFSL